MEERREVALAPLLPRRVELLAHEIVVDRLLERAEDTERHGSVRLVRDPRQCEREARLGVCGVMDEERVLAGLRDVDDPQRAVGVLLDAPLALDPEADPFPVLEVDAVALLLTDDVEGAVVVDVAVLEDLDERGATVPRRRAEHVRQALLVRVDAPARRTRPRRRSRRTAG